MSRMLLHCCLLSLLPLSQTIPALAVEKHDVTIYRCISSSGRLSLRDSPCRQDERQQVRTMQRPQDPPARPALPPPSLPAAPLQQQREVRIVTVQPARPMYECVTPDGEAYTSDTDAGNPRWVPLWVYGYPGRGAQGGRGRGHEGGVAVSGGLASSVSSGGNSTSLSIGGHSGSATSSGGHSDGPHPPVQAGTVIPAGGTLVRDECHALPQQEVCARLSDRRYAILRRYTSAMPSERRTLDLEQRGIDARMASDCPGY